MKKNVPILLIDKDDTIERPIEVLIKNKLVKSNVVVHATQDPVLFTDISECYVGKQKPSEINDLMFLLPNFMKLTLKNQLNYEKAEFLIKQSVKWN